MTGPLDDEIVVFRRAESASKAVVKGIQVPAEVTARAVHDLAHDAPEVLQALNPAAINGIDHSHERENSSHSRPEPVSVQATPRTCCREHVRFTERQVRPDRDRGFFLSLGNDLEQQLSAARVDLNVAKLVEQQQVQAAVAADNAGQLPVVGGFSELVDQLGGSGVTDPAALLAGGQPQADKQM